jgi:DUF305 family protein family protein
MKARRPADEVASVQEVHMVVQARSCVPRLAVVLTLGAASLAWTEAPPSPAVVKDQPGAEARAELAAEAPYLAENGRAMTKMMNDMAVKPTGNVDHDFVDMMVPHHQGAIDMAMAVLRHGRNEQLKRLAQEIIVTQQEEIAAMRLAVGESLPPSVPSPTQPSHEPCHKPTTSPDTNAK